MNTQEGRKKWGCPTVSQSCTTASAWEKGILENKCKCTVAHSCMCCTSTITSIKIYAYILCTMHWADSQGNNKASRLFLAVNTWGEFVTCHFLLSFFFSSFLGDALTCTHTMLMSPNGCSMLCFDEGRNMFCVIFLLSDRYHSSWRRVPAFYEFSLTWKINWRGIWNVLIFNPFSPLHLF